HTMVHLIMGKIFYHDDLSVSSTSGTGDMIMSENNNELNVSMSVRLGLSDDLDSAIKEDLRGLLQSVNVYQAFHVYLNRCEGGVTRKVIMGSPSISESQYIIISDPNGNATGVPNVSYSVGDMSVNHNYAEWISTDLASYFASEEKFKIISLVVISYPSGAIPVQFPSQTELNQDDGVTVSISSGIAFTKSNVSTSKNVILLDERPQKIYYSEAELDYAILDVNPIGDRVGSYTPLGINALNIEGADQTHATFDLLPVLGISAIADGIEDYQSAVITLQLSQRQNDGSYGNKIDIVNYLSVLYEGGTNSDVTSPDNNHYSMTISRSSGLLENNGAEIILPILHVTVETGSLLESAGHTYGNYRIDVTVTLYDSSGNAYTVSTASNYVIYTNVKVIPDFID
nr:hypothetical protein [Gammaproteobacteria bacterium]